MNRSAASIIKEPPGASLGLVHPPGVSWAFLVPPRQPGASRAVTHCLEAGRAAGQSAEFFFLRVPHYMTQLTQLDGLLSELIAKMGECLLAVSMLCSIAAHWPPACFVALPRVQRRSAHGICTASA